jgi:hypothetical protein
MRYQARQRLAIVVARLADVDMLTIESARELRAEADALRALVQR